MSLPTALGKKKEPMQQKRRDIKSSLLMISACCISFFLGRLSNENPAEIGKRIDLVHQDQLDKSSRLLQNSPDDGILPSNYKVPIGQIPPERMANMTTWTTVDIRGLDLCHQTISRGWEVVFDSLIGTIFREPGFLPDEGGVLDVGAQFAEQSCHYGSINPHRKVFTIDPSASNQQFANETFKPFMPNMNLGQHGLGKEIGEIRTDGNFFNMPKFGTVIPVYTIDSIFIEKGEKLAFAHIDVEGMELEVLKGGVKTIQQNQPVFSTELRVHKDHNYTRDLLNFIDNLGYDSYVVNEVCGTPFMDFRNILNIPRELSSRLVDSDVFSLALASETIFRVDSKTVLELVYPCCAAFGPCCPNGEVTKFRSGCCSEHAINNFLKDNPPNYPVPAAFKDWNGAKAVTEKRWKDLKARAKASAGQ